MGRETLVEQHGRLGRSLAHKHLIERCTQGIDIHLNGEIVPLAVVYLLDRSIARRATANRRARLGLARLIILLREAKVDQRDRAILA